MATTRVVIEPKQGGPNDAPSINAQSGLSKNRKFSGSGSDTDIITSSARAYVSALNKLLSWNIRRNQPNGLSNSVSGVGNAELVESKPIVATP